MVFRPFLKLCLFLYSLPLCIFARSPAFSRLRPGFFLLHRFTAWLVLHGKAVITSDCKASWGMCHSGEKQATRGLGLWLGE